MVPKRTSNASHVVPDASQRPPKAKNRHAKDKHNQLLGGITPEIRDLLEIAAWAQAWQVDIYKFFENYGEVLSFDRLIPLDLNHRSLTKCLSAAKQRHVRLYASLLKRAEAFIQAVREQHGTHDGQKLDLGAYYVPPHVLDWMWRVAQNAATRCVPIYKVIKELHIPVGPFFEQIKRKTPLLWREIWNQLGLGWSGKPEAAPLELLTRARMRKGAKMCAMGFTMAYASRQMGLSRGAVSVLKDLYPKYWGFLCREVRSEIGLSAGQNLAAQVINERGQVIVAVPRGMGRHARGKQRAAHGIKRPRYGRVLQSTPPGGEDSGLWSKPMTKVKMMVALAIDSRKMFNKYAAQCGIREAGSRQIFQLNLKELNAEQRDKLSRA